MARPLLVEIIADTTKFSRGIREAETRTSGLKKAAGVAGAAITGGLVVGLKKSVDAAIAAQTSTARMDQAFKTAKLSAGAFSGQISKSESAARQLGFTNADVRDSLGSLVVATHDGNKAIKDLSVAEDIARFKHIDLAQASKMLTMAMAGSQRATKQLGLDIPKVTTAQDKLRASGEKLTSTQGKIDLANAKFEDRQVTSAKVISTVSEKLHGQAQAFSETAAGGQAKYKAQMDALEESLGKGVLPAMTKVLGVVADLTDWFSRHEKITKVLVVAVAALGGALLAVNAATKLVAAATKVYTAMQWLLNAALDANPIGIVIVALGALAVALVIAWKKSQTFRDIVIGTWAAIKTAAQSVADFVTRTIPAAFQSVLNWVRSNWKVIAVLISGPFAPLVALATNAFGVRSALIGAFNAIKTTTSQVVSSIVGFWAGLPGRIGSAIAGAMGSLKSWIGKAFDPGKIVGWIKGALGFGSPSPFFMAIGKDMVDSIGRGVFGGANLLKDAVVNLAKKFLPSLSSVTHAAGGALGAVTKGGAGGLKPQVLAALSWARTHGWGGSVTSGYRSYAEQAALYQRYLHGGPLAAKPGLSSHESGSAVDVTDYTTFGRIMASAPLGARLYNRLGAADPVHYSISGYAKGGWAGLRGPELALLGEQGPEYVTPANQAAGPALVVQNMNVTSPAMADLVASRVMHRLAYR